MDRIFEDVITIADAPRLLAFGEIGAERGRRVEGADARAGGANALGERALRHELQLELARPIGLVEMPGVSLTRKRTQDLAHLLGGDERGKAAVAISGVVVDDGESARTLRDERVDQRRGHAGVAEAADHDRRAVGDLSECRLGVGEEFVDHAGGHYGIAPFLRTHLQLPS